jgi:hypothetical protein
MIGIFILGGSGELSRYSDLLWFGWYGDRIPVWAKFFVSVQTGPGAYPATYITGTGFISWG